MLNLLLAHWKKTRRTIIRPALLVLPLLYSCIVFIYCQHSNLDAKNEYSFFFLFLAISVELASGIIIALFLQLDKGAGNFGNELRIGVSRFKILASKVLFCSIMLLFVNIMATFCFAILEGLLGASWIGLGSVLLFLLGGSLLLLPTLLIYIWIGYLFDLTGNVIVGVLFVMSSFLLGVNSLGGNIPLFVPFTWPVQAVFGLIPAALWQTGNLQTQGQHWLNVLLVAAIFLTIVMFMLVFIWYNSWEGKRSLEE